MGEHMVHVYAESQGICLANNIAPLIRTKLKSSITRLAGLIWKNAELLRGPYKEGIPKSHPSLHHPAYLIARYSYLGCGDEALPEHLGKGI